MGRIRSSKAEEMPGVHLHAIDGDVEHQLMQWGAWAGQRMGLRHQARAAAAGARSGPPASSATVSVEQAWRVEQIVCNVQFSPRFRALLTAHYVHRASKMLTCRTLAIEWVAYELELWKAVMHFQRCARKFQAG